MFTYLSSSDVSAHALIPHPIDNLLNSPLINTNPAATKKSVIGLSGKDRAILLLCQHLGRFVGRSGILFPKLITGTPRRALANDNNTANGEHKAQARVIDKNSVAG